MSRQDLLGNDMTELEVEIAELYDRLKGLVTRDDLPPCAAANLRFATASVAQIMNDLDLEWEHLFELDV